MTDAEPKIQVIIRDNETGEARLYEQPDYDTLHGGEFNGWIWAEGNWSCDCNRHLFFQRAIGADEDWDRPCGENRYTVLAIFQNNRQVYGEPAPMDYTVGKSLP